MLFSLLLLLPLMAEGSILKKSSCILPPAPKESYNISNAKTVWIEQYRYPFTGGNLLGCLTYTQTPGANDNDIFIEGSFKHVPFLPVTGSATFIGNRKYTTLDGIWNVVIGGTHNVVYVDDEIFITIFCSGLGIEMGLIFTTNSTVSEESLEKIWEIVDKHPELTKSKFEKIDC